VDTVVGHSNPVVVRATELMQLRQQLWTPFKPRPQNLIAPTRSLYLAQIVEQVLKFP
jgi:hypothetical protein